MTEEKKQEIKIPIDKEGQGIFNPTTGNDGRSKASEHSTQLKEIKGKEYLYRGKPLDYLKTLDVRESAKYLPSSSRRTVIRNFDKIEKFIKICEETSSRNKKIRTHLRDIVIVPKLVGHNISIHNGKSFQEILITIEMIGHRLGEFAMTRSKVNHGSAGIGATKGSRAQKK